MLDSLSLNLQDGETMKEYYRALPNDNLNQPIEVDITDMTPVEKYNALNQLKEQAGENYVIKYHICDHGDSVGGCQEEEIG